MAEHVLVWLLVERDGSVLLTRRKATETPFAGNWVLPGDEMADSESADETIARVGRDELGVGISNDSFVTTLEILEGGNSYSINVFRVSLDGHPRYRESGPYEEAAWAPLAELRGSGLHMPPQLLDALLAANEGNES
jgi:ADP-ribose pyrophosphatase YjhB (NUDIX family)